MSTLAQNRLMYMVWLKNVAPALYRAAMSKALQSSNGTGVAGLGDWSDALSSFVSNVSDLASTYLTTKTQLSMVQQNTGRINSGLPPINTNGTIMTPAQMQAAGYSDVVISQVEANLANSNPLTRTVNFGSTQIPLWAIGLTVVGVIFLVMKRR